MKITNKHTLSHQQIKTDPDHQRVDATPPTLP